MRRIGITGHTNLTTATTALIADELRKILATQAPNLTGVTCLARGADQVFAQEVLALGGRLEVVLPAADYRTRKVRPENQVLFDALLARATETQLMPFPTATRQSYLAASEQLLSKVDYLIAVWDGLPAGSGTADVVASARDHGIPVTIVWPHGAQRT